MALARVQLPAAAKRGQVIEVRVAIKHAMETGFRFDNDGRVIPRNVVTNIVCRYNGNEVFRAETGSGIAANPYMQFHVVAETSGEFVLEWIDDAGERGRERAALTVTA